MKSSWIKAGPKSSEGCIYKRQRKRKQTKEEALSRRKKRLERCVFGTEISRMASRHQMLEEAR